LSSDFGASAKPWTEEAIKAGGLKYVDTLGFHPYGARELGSVRSADAYIAELRKDIAPYGKYQLWNTELYYLFDVESKNSYYDEAVFLPHHVAWRFLVDLGEGVTQSIAVPENCLWKKMLTPNMLTGRNYHEVIPSESFVAYNALARLFESAKPVKKLRLNNGVIAYVYRKDGKLIAALWSYEKRKGLHADLSPFHVMDIFGNPVKAEKTSIAEAPWYLTSGKLGDAEFLSRLETLTIDVDQTVNVAGVARLAGDKLMVSLHNVSMTPQNVTVGIANGELMALRPVTVTIPSREQCDLAIPVKLNKKSPANATVLLYINGRMFQTQVKIVVNVVVKNGEKFLLENAEGTVTMNDHSVTLALAVKDATDSGPTRKRQLWQTDCIELFFDLNPTSLGLTHPEAYTSNTFRVFITPRDAEKLVVWGDVLKAVDCRLKVETSSDGYQVLLTLPVKVSPYLGFDVKIDDAGTTGAAVKESNLSHETRTDKNRCNFGLVAKYNGDN